jgi:L-aminopeptidase/D-esterase-like protein
MGYAACLNITDDRSPQGSVGAGTGASCGKVMGSDHAMRGGLGTASRIFDDGLVVGALAVCNSWGDVIGEDGQIVAGARDPKNPERFIDTETHIANERSFDTRFFGMDTTLCVVATNARFSREQVTKLAMMAQDGIARATRPSHTMFDGDVVFALSLGDHEVDVNIAGSVAARLVWRAIIRAVKAANGLDQSGGGAPERPDPPEKTHRKTA